MVVAYDGTDYAGWQVQPNGVTVQQKLEQGLADVTQEAPKVHGSGRTDQGVHARRQVAHFDLRDAWTPVDLRKALNAVLPADIRVANVATAERTFHARRDAVHKEYRYFIWNHDLMPPWKRRYAAHVTNRLDVDAMRRAARLLVGRHDFAAFTANPNRPVETTVREILELTVRKRGSGIVVRVIGTGFLYKMVRSVAGFLIRVGEGAVPPDETPRILASRTRTARVPTAPPQGLFLWNVTY
jgi:tRNA pseudouridine38-40 synthase